MLHRRRNRARHAQVLGNLGTRFRVMEEARNSVHNLRCAPAEADVRCF
jgi:hypothetical protein